VLIDSFVLRNPSERKARKRYLQATQTQNKNILDMEPNFRCGTRKAIDELSIELGLKHEEWMQDWPWEVADPNDIDKYIYHYKVTHDEDKKFLIMEAIIQATTDQADKFEHYWSIVKQLIITNFNIHEYSVYYWSCFESDDIHECWTITPSMRQLWSEYGEKTTNR
jgi:hypothetical protein